MSPACGPQRTTSIRPMIISLISKQTTPSSFNELIYLEAYTDRWPTREQIIIIMTMLWYSRPFYLDTRGAGSRSSGITRANLCWLSLVYSRTGLLERKRNSNWKRNTKMKEKKIYNQPYSTVIDARTFFKR